MQDVRKDRDKYIGGSDVPIILGISPFKTRWQLLQEKAKVIENTFDGNEYTEYGDIMEPKIRDYVNDFMGLNFVEDKTISRFYRYHADGHDKDKNYILEIKTTSDIGKDVHHYKKYIVQMLLGMRLNGSKLGVLAVYEREDKDGEFIYEFDRNRLHIYFIRMNQYEKLADKVFTECERFWADRERLIKYPELTEEAFLPFELVALADACERVETQLVEMKRIEEESKKYKQRLKDAMQHYGVKKWTTNNGVKITLIEDGEDTVKKVFDDKKLKKEEPEIYEKYLVEKTVKGRAGYVRITI